MDEVRSLAYMLTFLFVVTVVICLGLEFRNHMVTNNMKKLSIPRIGAGLDCLKWNKVVEIIHEIFEDTDIHITVYVYVPPGFGV